MTMNKIFKITFLTLFTFSTSLVIAQKEVISVAPDKSVALEFNEFSSYEAKVANKSKVDLEIKVIDKKSQEQLSGFGLGKKKTQKVMLRNSSKLVVVNKGDAMARVVVTAEAKEIMNTDVKPEYISFTLRNNSAKSIPLIIPTVMNPNLSPFSNSGVDLKVGQEILFKNKGRKYVLLTVTNEIKDGEVLEVSKLLKDKRKELGI